MIYTLNGSNLYASIVRPESGKIYFKNREIMSIIPDLAIIIGKINIEANVMDYKSGMNKVEFYIDDVLLHSDYDIPYEWLWNEFAFGNHEIKVVAYDAEGNKAESNINVVIFNLGREN
jgi:hypothetical protein